MSLPGLILGVDSNCSGVREKCPSCVQQLRNRIKPKFPGVTYRQFGDFSTQARLSFPPPKLLAVQASKVMGLPVERSHKPSETTDPEGQPAGSSEEPIP